MRNIFPTYCLTRVSHDQAATNAIIQTLASSDHVLCIDDVYGGTQRYHIITYRCRFSRTHLFLLFHECPALHQTVPQDSKP